MGVALHLGRLQLLLNRHLEIAGEPYMTSECQSGGMDTAVPLAVPVNPVDHKPRSHAWATRLPTELWHIIIRKTDRSYYTCSLVCRQWRDIALPFLFRQINLPHRGRGLEGCAAFFKTCPTRIAELVRYVAIANYPNIIDLDVLLGHLPNLQELSMETGFSNQPERSGLPCELGLGRRKYKFEALRWYSNYKFPEVWLRNILGILSLFSKVDTLDLDYEYGPYDEGSLGSVAQELASVTSLGQLSMSKLFLRLCPAALLSSLHSYLVGVSALNNITQLAVSLIEPENLYIEFNKMLFLVGPQLKDLSVSLPMGTTYTVTHGLYDISGRHLAKFWPGFSACTGLEKFSLSIVTTDKPYREDHAPDIMLFHSAWDIAAGILKSVSADNVLVLSLAIEIVPTDSGDEEDALELDFIHSLPWQVLQNACRRLSCLHTFWPDITFDLREYDPSHYDQCVRYELRGFPPDSHHWYDYSDDPTRCSNPECRRYNSKAVLTDRAASTN